MEKICGIYKIENLINGKSYIGQSNHILRRFREHRTGLNTKIKHGKHFISAWHKYGQEHFSFDVVEICDESSLNEKEIYYIDTFNSFNNGYNETSGGEGTRNVIRSKEWSLKQSLAHSGKKNPNSNPNKNRKISDIIIKEIKQSIKDGNNTLKEIATKFEISYNTIKEINSNRCYKDIVI